jgi:hypothetical protein
MIAQCGAALWFLLFGMWLEPVAAPSATDKCQLYAITDPPITLFYCEGNCDNQSTCSQITVTVNGNSGTTCACGPAASNVDCLGAVMNKGGTITWECEANGCVTGCTNPANQQGAVCSCS